MASPQDPKTTTSLTLPAQTATDLMTPNPVSINQDATVKEAAAFLLDRGFSAAPVIDHTGRPIGVLSRADIVAHHRQQAEYVPPVPDYYQKTDLTTPAGEPLRSGFQVEHVDTTQVRDIMTPVVFSVAEESTARQVVADMVRLRVHRLFVVDHGGVLIGVISALDVLRHLN